MSRGEQGAALAIVVVSAVVFSLAAYAMLAVSSSKQQLAHYQFDRLASRFGAESGLIAAYQRLFANGDYPNCTAPGSNMTDTIWVDTDGNSANGDETPVNLLVTNCGAGRDHLVSATVTF